jgi:TetR/AcrR family transcriptional regulator, fatty acid metabolism regulator protein
VRAAGVPTKGDTGRNHGTAQKRRQILDAAVRVFARQGYHTCRVSDIADEAKVAYGLVYHYFGSKDEILDTLFLERWQVLLSAIAAVDARDEAAEAKLRAVAEFIFDSYAHDPELMQVIIVEVTRAASTFGRTHLPEIREAYAGIASIVRTAQERGEMRADVPPDFVAMAFYGAVEQVLTGWIFDVLPGEKADSATAAGHIVQTIAGGLRLDRRP